MVGSFHIDVALHTDDVVDEINGVSRRVLAVVAYIIAVDGNVIRVRSPTARKSSSALNHGNDD
jgi:hypothetical protein